MSWPEKKTAHRCPDSHRSNRPEMTRGTEFHREDHFVNFTSSLLSPLSGSLLFVMPFCAKAIIRLARRLVTLWSGRTHTATKTSTDPREAHTRPTSCRSSLRLGHAFLVVSSGTCKHTMLSATVKPLRKSVGWHTTQASFLQAADD